MVLTALFALLGAAWGLQEHFTPREVTELWISDLQKNQMQIQHNLQIQQAQQWFYWYQTEVERLTGECAREPYNQSKKAQLEQAKARRDDAKRKWDALMLK